MARYELRYDGTPDAQRRNPFTGELQTFRGKPRWVKSLVVSRHGNTVLVRAGKEPKTRLGTRRMASAESAAAYVTNLVASHLRVGYVLASNEEIDPAAVVARSAGDDEPLLARMAAGDADAFYVYADQLLERGDPRGQLMALLALPSSDSRARDGLSALIEQHPDVLAGPLAGRLDRSDATWRHGFLDGLRIAYDFGADDTSFDAAQLLAEVFAHPSSRLLRSLTVGVPTSGEVVYDDVIDVIASGAPETLSTLFIGDFSYPDETEMSWAKVGDASSLWLALPNLEDVTFQGAEIALGVLEAPSLRRLALRTGGLKKEPVQAITNGLLPRLEELELWLGDAGYGAEVTDTDLAGILAGRLPSLTRLAIKNAHVETELCELIVASRALPKLRALDLSLSTLDDDGAAVLLRSRHCLAGLEVLDVSRCCLSPSMCGELRSSFPMVRLDSQRGADARYVAVSE